MTDRPRAKTWPPRRHLRVELTPTPSERASRCPECGGAINYTPPPGVRDIDCVTCSCGYQFIVDLSGALEHRSRRTFESIPEERKQT